MISPMLINALRSGAMMNQAQNPMEGQMPTMGGGFNAAFNPAMAVAAQLRKKNLGGGPQIPQPGTMQQPQPIPQQPPQMGQPQQPSQPQQVQPQMGGGPLQGIVQALRTKGSNANMLGGAAQGALQGAAMGGFPGAIMGGAAGFLQNGGMEKIKPMLQSLFKIF